MLDILGVNPQNQRKYIKISDLCEFIVDCIHDTPKLSNSFTGYFMIRTSDVGNGHIYLENARYVSKDVYNFRIQRGMPKRGDIVISREAPLGNVGQILENERICLGQRLIHYRPNPDVIDARYLLFALLSPTVQQEFRANGGTGSIIDNLRMQAARDLKIPVPPRSTQRAIAEILGSLDDKIELNHRMNRTLESIARAVFREWFVVGENVGDWEVGKIGDVSKNLKRSASADKIAPETFYIGLEHMPRGSIALSEWGNANELASNKFIFKKGELLFGKLRPYFHKVGIAPIDGVCSTDILVIAPKSPVWFGFVLCHLSSTELINYTTASSTGTNLPRTNWTEIANYEIAIPPAELVMEFNKFFLPLAQQIQSNIMESRVLAGLRDYLLPKLMNGKVSVRN